MKSAAESHNVILHSIVRSGQSVYVSLVAALEKFIVCAPVLDNWVFCSMTYMDVIYPQ